MPRVLTGRPFRSLAPNLLVITLAVWGVATAALAQPGGLPRPQARVPSPALKAWHLGDGKAPKTLSEVAPSGQTASESPKPFDVEGARALASRLAGLGGSDRCQVRDVGALESALSELQAFQAGVEAAEAGTLSREELARLETTRVRMENLLGVALKGKRSPAALRLGPHPSAPGDGPAPVPGAPKGPSKFNTGWILDQHLFDPDADDYFPTILSDWRSYNETASDIAMGSNQGGGSWVWSVQSFYWTDTTLVTDHANPSYCLAILVSPDGGSTWLIYTILYDPTDATHTVALDLVNPKLAVDITVVPNRLFIAYECAYDATDHDVLVYTEEEFGTTGQTDVVAGTLLMERNPAVAADYTDGQTAYIVAAWEAEYRPGGADYDIYASQCEGSGATPAWSTAVAVAEDSTNEANPALFAGATGSDPYTAYMHLAYNNVTYGSGTQLLLNPGFELGNNGNWTVRVSGDISCNGSNTHAGSCKAWLGGTDSQPNDWIYQQVAIPSGALFYQFSMWLKIVSADSTTTPYDYFYIEVRDTSGAVLKTLGEFDNTDEATYVNYVQLRFNMAEFAGQTVRIHFWASTDVADITSFYVDDTALTVVQPSAATAHQVLYARAEHPGGTPYPDGLSAATKVTVLDDWLSWGATAAYGPPSVSATHGGGTATIPGSRVVVTAHRLAPVDKPNVGDPQRYQVFTAWNMCNGGTTCGSITCSPSNLTLNWQKGYFYNRKSDEMYPSLVTDGMGLGTNACTLDGHPFTYMAFYSRVQASSQPYGEVQMIIADAEDETCAGFASGAWYSFTLSAIASDEDGRAYPAPRTVIAMNYWDMYPGVGFHKMIFHPGSGSNLDPYFTTLGDNYTFDSLFGGAHLDSWITYWGEKYSTPWTFAWAAGYAMVVDADPSVTDSGRYYAFTGWTDGATTPTTTILTDFCAGTGPCPETTDNALYGLGCLTDQTEVTGDTAEKVGIDVLLTWPAATPGDVGSYTIYRATNATSADQFTVRATTTSNAFLDDKASGDIFYYIIVATCGPFSGPWGHYGQ